MTKTNYLLFYWKKIKNLICVLALGLISGSVNAQLSSKYTWSYLGTVSGSGAVLPATGFVVTPVTGAASGTDATWTNIDLAVGNGAVGSFSFNFNCQNYTSVGISQNGFIWFGSGTCSSTQYTPLSSQTGETGTVAGIVSVYGCNLVNSGTSATANYIRYNCTGTAPNRIFSVEWRKVSQTGVTQPCDYRIRLNETTNSVVLEYYDNPYGLAGTANGQVGMRGATTTDFINRKVTAVSANWCNSPAGTLNTDLSQIASTSSCNWASNGTNEIKYTYAFTGSCCTPPSTSASGFGYSNVVVNGTNSTADFSFTRGNGDGGVIAIAKAGSAPSAPSNGTVYSGASTVYGSGTAVGGGFLVYAATGSGSGTINVSLSSLTNGVTYYISVYEYNAAATCYTGSPLAGNIPIPVCSPPSSQASGNSVSNIQTNQADINWTGNGNGDDVIVFVKQGSAISTDPTQTTNYNASAVFGSGNQIGATGAYAVYKNTGSSVTVTGLSTNLTYFYAIYAHNATTNCYTVPPVTGSFTTTNSQMTTSAQVVTQVSVANVNPGSTNNQILQLRMDCGTGTAPALVMGQLFFTTAASNGGTTNPADIANAKVYYTGTSSTFSTATQYGSTVVSPNGTFTVSGSTTLVPGSNYFWLTYDIISSPTIGDYVDAKLSTIDVGAILTPSGDPAGNRQINPAAPCSPTFGSTACSTPPYIDFGMRSASFSGTTFCSGLSCSGNYTDFYPTITATLNQSQSYALTVNYNNSSSLVSFSIFYHAWVDWNNDGVFSEPSERIMQTNVGPAGATTQTGAPFTVSAGAGSYRMRVICQTGSDQTNPCTTGGGQNGEAKDFKITVIASSSPMTYASSTTTQNTSPILPNNNNVQVIGLQVVTAGALSPIALSSLTFNTNGSTNIAGDATNARVFYTGTSGAFATGTQFGSTITNPNGSYTLTGSQTLSPGTNYFWVAYDVPSTATIGDNLDAECTSIIVNGTTYSPSITAPSGVRPITMTYCVPSAGATGCSLGGDSWITAVSLNGTGSTFNFTGGTCLTPYPNNYEINSYTGNVNQGASYTETMVKGSSSYGARFISWIDFNNNGVFTDPGEMVMDVTQSGASATGTSFTVPALAPVGAHRMRTWIGYTGTIVTSDVSTVTTGCEVLNGASNQGEVRDFTVNVVGGCTAPLFTTCPSNISLNATSGLCNASTTYTTATSGTAPVTLTYAFTGATTASGSGDGSGSTFNVGTTNVTITATNACGNATCTFSVTITDNQNPTVTCPANITVNNAPDVCSAVVTYSTPTGSDNCGVASVNCLPASGSTFNVGTTAVTCTVTDVNSNTGSCSFNVIVNDNQNPTIACPSDITTNNDAGNCSAVVTYTTPTGSDNCGVASVNCLPASGSAFNVGATAVTCTVTDVNGNTGSCSFNVIVNDNQNPTVACPSDITTNNDAGNCSAVVTYTTPTGSDNCGVASVNCLPASGSAFNVGTTAVTCTVTDVNGNTGSCSFNVIVNDNQNPTVACPANITTNNDPGNCSAVVTYTTPTGSDNCGVASVNCLPASGSTFNVGTTAVTCTVTDVNGNTGSCSFNVIVNDNQNPTVACPANITTNNDAGLCSAVVTYTTPTGSDNCGVAGVNCLPASGSAFNVGTTAVTCIVTDIHGNTGSCSFNVIVNDNENPTISCPANISQCNPVVTFNPVTSDNCSVATTVCTPASGSTFTVGTTTVNCTVNDVNGNSASCSFSVTVLQPSIAATSISASPASVCTNGNTDLTVVGGTLGDGADWKWYKGSCGGTAAGAGLTINTGPLTVTTTFYVRAEGTCNNTSCVSFTVIVSTAPPANSIGTPTVPAYACSGTIANATCNSVSGATTYTWDGPAGTTFDGSNPSPYNSVGTTVSVTYGPPNGSGYNICVQANNACGSTNRKCGWVRGTVNVPASITPANGRTIECPSSSASYSIAAVGGATSYQWTITGNATVSGTGTTVTVNFGPGWTGGNLCVAAQTPCYTSATKCLALSNVTATPGTMTGATSVCPNSSGTYSIPAVTGAATYNWTLPSGATGSSSTNSILVNFGASYSGGVISVTITSICGVTSTPRTKTVNVGLPAVPASISGPIAGLCNQTVVFNCPATSGASTYTWTLPSGGTINSGQGSTSINASFGIFTNGNACVKANNGCGSSANRCVAIKGSPTITGSITYDPNPFCAFYPGVDFQIAPVFGTTNYNWIFPSGASVIVPLSNEQIVQWGANGGVVSVTAANACGNATKNLTITLTCREGESLNNEESVTDDLQVYPNPAHDKVKVNFISKSNDSFSLNIRDLSGRIIKTLSKNAIQGLNSEEINLADLAKGIYIIDFQSTDIHKQIRFALE